MFYLMKMGVLYNRLSTSLIMLRVFGKELFDSIKHCFGKYSDDIEKVWNKFPDSMHAYFERKDLFKNNSPITVRCNCCFNEFSCNNQ